MEAQPVQSPAPVCPGCDERDRKIAGLEAQLAGLRGQLAALEGKVAAAIRGGKRQAAPFSKGPPKANPKTPGRKPGADYGPVARRAVPPVVDEVHEAPLPCQCPDCGGTVEEDKVQQQYQTEIPRRPIHRQFNVHIGHCVNCDRPIQGRHPLQTSDALGCCASQIGPDAQALIVHLNKDAGLSHGKISKLFSAVFDISISRGGVCQAMLRAAGKCLPQYHQIILQLGTGTFIVPDETGWRIGGKSSWLHTFVGQQTVAYLIARERGFEASSRIIPEDYAGTLIHDGWKSYDKFRSATHQTCNAHLLRRCKEMLEVAKPGAAIFLTKVKTILQEGLETRDRRDAGEITPATAARKGNQLQAAIAQLTEGRKTNPANERFAAHLYRYHRDIFTYLKDETIDATNYRAEQAIRPAVVNRKVWGGSRTEDGAAAQSILMSVLQTAGKCGHVAMTWLSGLLRSPAETPPLLPAAVASG